jgi:hypothetical protein
MRVSDLSIWEQLGGLQGWSELAANCDASPFAWPTFCLPWWYETGWGRLTSIAVEESGLLVGLALLHDQVGDVGRHMVRFIADEPGTYHQLLAADGRDDVIAVLLEELLSSGREIDLAAVPTDIAQSYQANTSCPLAFTEHVVSPRLVSVPLDDAEVTPITDTVRKVTDSAECLDLITGPAEAVRWESGAPKSKTAAFFASAVDASVRAGRMTLHIVEEQNYGPTDGVLVVHGSGTSVVWRHVGRLGASSNSALIHAVRAEVAERGSGKLLWPDRFGVSGQPFALTDIGRVRSAGGRLHEFSANARGAIRGVRDYLSS